MNNYSLTKGRKSILSIILDLPLLSGDENERVI